MNVMTTLIVVVSMFLSLTEIEQKLPHARLDHSIQSLLCLIGGSGIIRHCMIYGLRRHIGPMLALYKSTIS